MGRGYGPGEIRSRIIGALDGADGMPGTEVAERIGVSRITASKYLREFAAEGLLRKKEMGNATLWYLEPGQESLEFPADYFRAAEQYLGHLAACDAGAAQALARSCINSGATATRMILEVVEPAASSISGMYESGKIGSAERGLMASAISGTLHMLSQAPVAADPRKGAIVLAADPQSVLVSEAASAAYRSEGWEVWHLGDMSAAADVLFDIDFEKLAGRVWKGPGTLVAAVFSASPEGLGFFAGSMGPARKKLAGLKLALCGPVPEGAGCDLAAGRLSEVLQWSRTVAEK